MSAPGVGHGNVKDIRLTFVGVLTADIELRFHNEQPVANFTLASTPSKWSNTEAAWVPQETIFMPCAVWKDQALRVAGATKRGDRLVVVGKLQSHSWPRADGKKITRLELWADEVAYSFRELS